MDYSLIIIVHHAYALKNDEGSHTHILPPNTK